MLAVIFAFRTAFSCLVISFNPQEFVQKAFGDVVVVSWPLLLTMVLSNEGGWLIKYSTTLVVGVAIATFIWRRTWIRKREKMGIDNLQDLRTKDEVSNSCRSGGGDDSELKCYCGLPAKLRISRTFRNPYRLFYKCPNNAFHHQCEYFLWSDEMWCDSDIERSRKERDLLQNECIRLHKKIADVEFQRQNERALWERQRRELRLKASAVEAELHNMKRIIQELNEVDNMPPFHQSYSFTTNDDDDNDAVVILTIGS